MVAQTREVLVPQLNEAFWKFGYDHATQDQAQTVKRFILGSDIFVM